MVLDRAASVQMSASSRFSDRNGSRGDNLVDRHGGNHDRHGGNRISSDRELHVCAPILPDDSDRNPSYNHILGGIEGRS